jgi:hypothetical protein
VVAAGLLIWGLAIQSDLDSTRQELESKQQAADANTETERAQAQAEQATVETKAAESRAAIAIDCAKAFIAAVAALLEGDDPEAQAEVVREQLDGIAADCEAQLAG